MNLATAEPTFEQVTAGLVLDTPAWMTAAPTPIRTGSTRFELAPGIWIVRQARWWPVAVLDTGLLPAPDLTIEPVPRQFPFPDWHTAAACLAHPDGDALFFGVDDKNHPPLAPTAIESARSLCRGCPVAVTCLTWALEAREEFGIWGGTTGRQRAKLQKRRRLGATVEGLVSECLPAPA